MKSIHEGYNQQVEDRLLESVEWREQFSDHVHRRQQRCFLSVWFAQP